LNVDVGSLCGDGPHGKIDLNKWKVFGILLELEGVADATINHLARNNRYEIFPAAHEFKT
jgi:hypothetical protein